MDSALAVSLENRPAPVAEQANPDAFRVLLTDNDSLASVHRPMFRSLFPLRAGLPAKVAARIGIDRKRPVVEIEKCAGYRFPRFGPGGAHPLQLAAALYAKSGSTDAATRFLYDEIAKFRPMTLAQSLFDSNEARYAPLNTLPALTIFHPWNRKMQVVSGFLGQGSDTYKAVSRAKLAAKVKALTTLVDSLARLGYRPEEFGFVRGYFLLRNSEYRFLLTEGTHRVSSLAALGYERIEVRLARRQAAVVDVADVDRWPHVRSGYCSRVLALQLVSRYFD